MGKQDGRTRLTAPELAQLGRRAVDTLDERAHAEISGEAPRVGAVPPYAFYGTDAGHLARAIVETCA